MTIVSEDHRHGLPDGIVEVPQIGIGFRRPFARWINSQPQCIHCLEVTAEHFFDTDGEELGVLGDRYPVSVHGLGLSLGSPGPPAPNTLKQFCRVAEQSKATWISEHIAFTRTNDVDLGHLNPLPMSRNSLETLVDNARRLVDVCQRPLCLENITSWMRIDGDMPETDFLNELCRRAECWLLLDVTNLFINSHNHRFDPRKWLDQLDTDRVRQLHLVGYSEQDGTLHDKHSEPIQDELFDLTEYIVARAPVEAVFVERDVSLPPVKEIALELTRLSEVCRHARGG